MYIQTGVRERERERKREREREKEREITRKRGRETDRQRIWFNCNVQGIGRLRYHEFDRKESGIYGL